MTQNRNALQPAGGVDKLFDPALRAIEDIHPQELFANIWRRKWSIFLTILIVTTLVSLILSQLAPRYTAESVLMIEGQGKSIVGVDAVVNGLSQDAETIASEIEVIRSRKLAGKLVDKLGLLNKPEFNSELRPKGFIKTQLEKYFPPSAKKSAGSQRVKVIDEFLDRLTVAPKGQSHVITVSFTSEDRTLAAKVANSLAEAYLHEQLEAKFEATHRANRWLNGRISSLRKMVQEKETEVERFRRQSGLLAGQSGTLNSQQMSELNTQLILARTARAESEARLGQAKRLVNSGNADSAAEVLQSSLIQNLRSAEADLDRSIAELSSDYGSQHPRMINLLAEKKDLQSKIRNEVNKVVRGLQNEVNIARAREGSLRRNLESLKSEVATSNEEEVKLRALERDAEAGRSLLQTFLLRFKETSSQEDVAIQQADARIISYADIPGEPSFPKTIPIIALSLVGSGFLGLLVAFLGARDPGFRSSDQIEYALNVPVLGLVPKLGGMFREIPGLRINPIDYLCEHPYSAYGESMRTISTSIRLADKDVPPKKIMITSALPNEGKSTLSVCLSYVQAKGGSKVVIVEADIRKPSLQRVTDLGDGPGLLDYLTGKADLDEVIYTNRTSPDIIPATNMGAPKSAKDDEDDVNLPTLFDSERMDTLLKYLEAHYDYVIIDSPPVLAASDARILAEKVDMTVYVIRWADTRKEVARLGLQQFANSGCLVGTVLSIVDVKEHASYKYADSGYYHGKLKKYYNS